MPHTIEAIALTAFVLATSIWVGGYVAIAVVARVSSGVLDPPTRVAFFRALGQRYLWVGAPALVVALGTGALLARDATDRGLFVVIAGLLRAALGLLSVALVFLGAFLAT